MMMARLKLAVFATLLALTACAQAQTETPKETSLVAEVKAPPSPCQDVEYRQLDFWVGEWVLTWDNGNGTAGTGTNIISREGYGDCVITERFDGAPTSPLKGLSVSTYSKAHEVWRQTWVDNQGGYFALYGGSRDDGTFILEMERLGNKGSYSRMVFENIEKDSFVWRWQGKKLKTDDWTDQWVINYTRK